MSEKNETNSDNNNENKLQSPLIEIKEGKENNKEKEKIKEEEDYDSTLSLSAKNIQSIKSISYVIKRRIRWIIFSIFAVINLLMNFDHGIIPAATEQLRNYLDLTDSELGLFGSFVFIGVIIGSLISLTIINTFNRKYILMVCLILCGFSLFLFTVTKKYALLCIDRVIVGTFQAFISIYLPLWCEQFGIEARKAIMMALIQVAPPLGVLVGYVVTTILNMSLKWLPYFGDIEKDERWLYAFYIQSILIWGLSIGLGFFPDKYFKSKARRIPIEIEDALNNIEKKESGNIRKLSFFYEGGNENFEFLKENVNSPNNSEKDENEDNENNENNENNQNKEKEKNINYQNTELNKDNKEQNLNISMENLDNKEVNNNKEENNQKDNNNGDNNKEANTDCNNENDNNKNEINENNSIKTVKKEIPFLRKLKLIFSEPLFICCALTMSILYFIVTCVQYWSSDYMLIALEVEDETKRLYSFSVVCLTSPTLGLILGGFIVDKLGGYSKKSALIFTLIASLLSILTAIPLPLVNSLYLYAGFLWILLFFGASLIPTIQGVSIACLPKDIQGSGNSFFIFFYNLLGYLPAPFAYGFFKDSFDDKNDPKKGSRVAQKITSWTTIGAPILIGISIFFRFTRDEEYTKKMGREQSLIGQNADIGKIRSRQSSMNNNKEKADNINKEENNNEKNVVNIDIKEYNSNENKKDKLKNKNDNKENQ